MEEDDSKEWGTGETDEGQKKNVQSCLMYGMRHVGHDR